MVTEIFSQSNKDKQRQTMYKTYNCKQLTLASNKNLKPLVGDITAESEEHTIFRAGKHKWTEPMLYLRNIHNGKYSKNVHSSVQTGENKTNIRIWHLKRTSLNIAYQKRLSFRPITQEETLA